MGKHKKEIDFEGLLQYADALSTGSYGDLQQSNISENSTELIEKSVGQLNKEYEDQWIEENVDMGMAPDLALSPLMSGKSLLGLVKKARNLKDIKFGLPKNIADLGNRRAALMSVEDMASGEKWSQPMYRSSGSNSKMPGEWLPFKGYDRAGGPGSFLKQYSTGPGKNAWNWIERDGPGIGGRHGDEITAELSKRLTSLDKSGKSRRMSNPLKYSYDDLHNYFKGEASISGDGAKGVKRLIDEGVQL